MLQRAVIIQGQPQYQGPSENEVKNLELGSYFGSEGQAYAQSKLAQTMWSFYLANNVPDIFVIAVNPGSLLNTKMVEEAFRNSWLPADKGTNILNDLAISEEYEGISGKYFGNDKGTFGKAHQDAYDRNKIDRLVEATNKICLIKTIKKIIYNESNRI